MPNPIPGKLSRVIRGLEARGFPDASEIVAARVEELLRFSSTFAALVRESPDAVPTAWIRHLVYQRGITQVRKRDRAEHVVEDFAACGGGAPEQPGLDLMEGLRCVLQNYVEHSEDSEAERSVAMFCRFYLEDTEQEKIAVEFEVSRRTVQRRIAKVQYFVEQALKAEATGSHHDP